MNSSSSLDYRERVILICKPEQSGKTFQLIKLIVDDIMSPPHDDKTVVNFIFCDNNLLLTKQTSERVKREVESNIQIEVDGEVMLQFSSKSKQNKSEMVRDA